MTHYVQGAVRRYQLRDVLAARAMAAAEWARKSNEGDRYRNYAQFLKDYPTQRQYVDEWWEERYIDAAIAARHNILGDYHGATEQGKGKARRA